MNCRRYRAVDRCSLPDLVRIWCGEVPPRCELRAWRLLGSAGLVSQPLGGDGGWLRSRGLLYSSATATDVRRTTVRRRLLSANLAGDHLAEVANATEHGVHRINANPRLPWSFLAHTGLTIHPPHPPNLRKDQ